jgi:hypothetical protein
LGKALRGKKSQEIDDTRAWPDSLNGATVPVVLHFQEQFSVVLLHSRWESFIACSRPFHDHPKLPQRHQFPDTAKPSSGCHLFEEQEEKLPSHSLHGIERAVNVPTYDPDVSGTSKVHSVARFHSMEDQS